MPTLEEHLAANRERIEREVPTYAAEQNISIEKARTEIEDEYRQGWYDSMDQMKYEGGDTGAYEEDYDDEGRVF